MMQYRKILRNMDFVLMTTVVLILVMSLFILDSATSSKSTTFVLKQIINIVFGFGIFSFFLFADYNFFTRYSNIIYVASLLLLIIVLIPGIGHEAKGAQSWINFGSFMLQTSEVAKILIILSYAKFLSLRKNKLNKIVDLIIPIIYIGIPIALILLQPDLGTALVFIAIMVGMLFVAGMPSKYVLFMFGLGALAFSFIVFAYYKGLPLPLKGYQLMRIMVLVDPTLDPKGAGWNVIQAQIAIGSGGLFGKGLGEGTQNTGEFLPEQWTDFIFAVTGEELGFLGAIVLILLLFVVVFRGIMIATKAKDSVGALIAIGVVSMYTFHILENIGMNIGIMPVTGIPLPFVSYGGSSMLANMAGLGLLMNVYARRQKILF